MSNSSLGLVALIIIAFLCVLLLAAVTETTEEKKFNACIKAGIDKTECVEILKTTCVGK